MLLSRGLRVALASALTNAPETPAPAPPDPAVPPAAGLSPKPARWRWLARGGLQPSLQCDAAQLQAATGSSMRGDSKRSLKQDSLFGWLLTRSSPVRQGAASRS